MRRLLALLVMCAIASPAAAEYPDRPIHLIVPQAAGSATDTLARIFGASFGDALGQTVIIDDRPGGALTVGMDAVAKAPPTATHSAWRRSARWR
jgi:tripartite-type tricarboxylate transporter receptor subunit TctC